MVAPGMDFSGLFKPNKTVVQHCDKYQAPDDLDVQEARMTQDQHYGVITAQVFKRLSEHADRNSLG